MTTHDFAGAANKVADVKVKQVTPEFDVVSAAMQDVEQLMYDIVDSDVKVLRDASRHILEAGGKRIRPRMILLSYAATGGKNISSAVAAAAAIELVHTASVVHDDINDHGVVRRGRPSVNSIWGRTFALLTGDFLFSKVYELMAPYGSLNELFAQATTALVEGETLQASAVKNNNLSREVYMEIIDRKTAALFRMGAMMGARLSGASSEQITSLGIYGKNIGLAFQIIDDILDLTGDVDQLGKTAGLDLQQGKGFGAIQDNGSDPMDNIKAKLMKGDRIVEARTQAIGLTEIAIESLAVLPDSLYKDQMVELAHTVVERSS